jgi:hypothetical protein
MKIMNAILSINPNAKIVVNHEKDDLDSCTIQWIDGTAEISKEDIKIKLDELQADYDSQDYARKRQKEYPTIEELVVALYDTEDKLAIENKRAEVKAKYPKP